MNASIVCDTSRNNDCKAPLTQPSPPVGGRGYVFGATAAHLPFMIAPPGSCAEGKRRARREARYARAGKANGTPSAATAVATMWRAFKPA